MIPEAHGLDNNGIVPWQIVDCEPCVDIPNVEGKKYSSSVFLIPCYFFIFSRGTEIGCVCVCECGGLR